MKTTKSKEIGRLEEARQAHERTDFFYQVE